MAQNNSASPFDEMASVYDLEYTDSLLGRIYRERVQERMDCLFTGQKHILELGCGTGEDALYLAKKGHKVTAIDSSEKMIEQARVKIERAGFHDKLDLRVMNIENMELSALQPLGEERGELRRFDGVLANFGVLNCVEDLNAVAIALHSCLVPGSPALFVIMGPLVPWEWLWYLFKGKPGKSFRRLRRGGVDWRGIRIRYPGIRKARTSFEPFFRISRISALGTFLPPPYTESWAQKNTGWIKLFEDIERRWANSSLAILFADHYLLEMETTIIPIIRS